MPERPNILLIMSDEHAEVKATMVDLLVDRLAATGRFDTPRLCFA